MKLCTTCGRRWDIIGPRCPDDGTPLVIERSEAGGGDPDGAAGGAGGRAPRGIEAGRAGGASASATWSTEQPALAQLRPAARDQLVPGDCVGEYVIERRIGAGGMGVVYGARHPVIGKRAAIKILGAKFTADEDALSRFVLEAQAVNKIGHANIVDIFSFGTLDDGRSYFAMEWLQGETLGARLERGRLTVREACSILSPLCRALEAAHAAGVIHRDLKPDNVFLATDDDGWRVKLLDFGIAKLSTATAQVSRTATGVAMGTPLYMAPEQARGEAVDGRTDVYALGLLAYTMLCGVSLFEDEGSAIEILAAHINRPPVPPRERAPDLPAAFDALILEMIAKQPARRPALGEIRGRLAAIAAAAADRPAPLARAAALPVAPTEQASLAELPASRPPDMPGAPPDAPRVASPPPTMPAPASAARAASRPPTMPGASEPRHNHSQPPTADRRAPAPPAHDPLSADRRAPAPPADHRSPIPAADPPPADRRAPAPPADHRSPIPAADALSVDRRSPPADHRSPMPAADAPLAGHRSPAPLADQRSAMPTDDALPSTDAPPRALATRDVPSVVDSAAWRPSIAIAAASRRPWWPLGLAALVAVAAAGVVISLRTSSAPATAGPRDARATQAPAAAARPAVPAESDGRPAPPASRSASAAPTAAARPVPEAAAAATAASAPAAEAPAAEAPAAETPAAPPSSGAPSIDPGPRAASHGPSTAPITAEFAVEPRGAQLAVDGQPVPLVDGRAALALSPGDHEALASAGGRVARQRFTVTAGRAARVALRVPAAPATAAPRAAAHASDDVDGVEDPFRK